MTRDKNPELTKRQADNARAAIQVGVILQRLQECAKGQIEMSPTQVKAAQILLDKSLPTLQAIDQVIQVEAPPITPEEIEDMLKAMLRDMSHCDPEGFRQLLDSVRGPRMKLIT